MFPSSPSSSSIMTVLSSFLFPLALWTSSCLARVDLGGGYRGLAMTHTCHHPSTVSCTELDDDWPDQGLACPIAHHDIPRHTLGMMSATLIQLGRYTQIDKKDFPINECYTTTPNSTVSSYGFISQGTFDMWFFAHDKCNCPPNHIPICHERASEEDKCNLRTFTLCKVTKKTEICKPKHHQGWQPIPPIHDEVKTNSSLEMQEALPTDSDGIMGVVSVQAGTIEFGPDHAAPSFTQLSFQGFSSVWWKVMEILGVWGAI